MADKYKHVHQPYNGLIDRPDAKPEQKAAREDLLCQSSLFCNHGCKKEIFFQEVSASKAFDLFDDNARLKKNWNELKTQLAFSIQNYGDECDMTVATQVLKEMETLEGVKL